MTLRKPHKILLIVILLLVAFIAWKQYEDYQKKSGVAQSIEKYSDFSNGTLADKILPRHACKGGQMGFIGSYSSCFYEGILRYDLDESQVSNVIQTLSQWLETKTDAGIRCQSINGSWIEPANYEDVFKRCGVKNFRFFIDDSPTLLVELEPQELVITITSTNTSSCNGLGSSCE